MVTALITDADKPASKAKNHKNKITKTNLINIPLLTLSRGFNTKENISKIIPTCKPDTAKM